MTIRYDVVVAGGGPAGSAAAWQAVRNGARVLLCDKAEFPRDKPCGDGLTPRAVSYLQKMGLGDEVARFHRLNRATIFSPSEWELSFPNRPGMPDHGHGIRRTQLDTMLIEHAASAGADVRQGEEVVGAVTDDDGRVTGVTGVRRDPRTAPRGHRDLRRRREHDAEHPRLGQREVDVPPLDAAQPQPRRQHRVGLVDLGDPALHGGDQALHRALGDGGQQRVAVGEVAVGGVVGDPDLARHRAQHHAGRSVLAGQTDAGVDEGGPQVAVVVRRAGGHRPRLARRRTDVDTGHIDPTPSC